MADPTKPIVVHSLMYPVTVKFNPGPNTFEFGGCMVDNQLLVNQALGAIVLQLTTDGAAFAQNPISWGDNPQPGCMSVSRNSDSQVTIINWNTNMESGEKYEYEFEVTIWYGGIGYISSDPTIINATIPTPLPDVDDDDDEAGEHGHGRRVKHEPALRAV